MEHIIIQKKDKIPSVSVEFKKAKSTDTYGYLKLRVKHKIRKEPFLIAFGQKIEEKYWDKKNNQVKHTHPEADSINDNTHSEVDRVKEAFRKYINGGGRISEDVIKAVITGAEVREGDFLVFMKERIEKKAQPDKDGKASVSEGYIKHLWIEYNRVYEYSNGYLPYSAITTKWVEDYENWVRPKVKATTLSVKMKRLMEFVSTAKEFGLLENKKVAGYQKPEYIEPERLYLTAQQVDRIAQMAYKKELDNDPLLKAVACYFVIECLSGLRFSDWHRYTIETVLSEPALRVRTKKNNENVYLYLKKWPRLRKMCNYIAKHNIIFNYTERETNNALKTIRHLAKIPFEFTTHNGRHTAATLLAMLGYSDNEGAEILGITPGTFALYRGATRQDSRLTQDRLGGL